MLRSSAVEGQPKPQGWCDHRTRPMTVVFTEMGCHASCQDCGPSGRSAPPRRRRSEHSSWSQERAVATDTCK